MNTLTDTKTLEARPRNADAAVSTPAVINYDAIVRQCAERKSANGAQFTSTKGKSALLKLCVDSIRSQLNLRKHDDDGNVVQIPGEHFTAIKASINLFWESEAITIIRNGQERNGKVNIRRGVLGSKVDSKDKKFLPARKQVCWKPIQLSWAYCGV